MAKKITTVMVAIFTMVFLGGLVAEAQAVEEVTTTKIIKKIDKVEKFVRIADNVVIMFDSSGSMGAPYGDTGLTKLQAAKQLLKQRAALFPDVFPELKVGLYTYTPSAKLDAVKKSEFYKMQPVNKAELQQAIDQLPDEAGGPTLMVNGLRKLGNLLDTLSGRTVVFFFTDGTHSDEGATESPLVLAKKMAKKHDVNFQVISTTDDATNVKLMEAVASINESSRVYTLKSLIDRPEVYTGSVFAIEESYIVSFESRQEIIGFKLNHILFGFDETEIKIEFTEGLKKVGEILKKNPDSYLVLAGHTDNQGSEEYNLGLSRKRVEAVGAFLAKKYPLDPSRIEMFWYGAAAPIASNDTEEGRKQNRRVVGFIAGVD